MKQLILLLLFLSGCTALKHQLKVYGYLVTVEAGKLHNISVHKVKSEATVDSIVLRNFGYAIKNFDSDTLFDYSPYFRIETINKTIYGEKKELIIKSGKLKFKKLK